MAKTWLDQLLIKAWGISVDYDAWTQRLVWRVLSGALMLLLPAELMVMAAYALTAARWLISANFLALELLVLIIGGIFEIDGLHARPQPHLSRPAILLRGLIGLLWQTALIVLVALVNGVVFGFIRVDRLSAAPWDMIGAVIMGAAVATLTRIWTQYQEAG
ncbi:hypothetical protein [Lacticaseibacillus camelliae]|uniref:Uncharacterized protein n=1 Tax=Lacticaseibacillus camelliae DSM 22697 = JCM 13995 TaxID=1423730 RepID=A0A0R2F8I0_9LACO|nr:hypothetical protein [Lacticaseibacillus camelliae]KRN21674.1 hypothetical protein FC75_GL002135 [Lacticaseibacillus camelliae DSM 22697 = JCM 13995]